MTEYSTNNRGSIWKNDRKESDNHPDFTGTLNVEGIDYFVSAWKRKPAANPKSPALSFSIKKKNTQKNEPENRQSHYHDKIISTSSTPSTPSELPGEDYVPF